MRPSSDVNLSFVCSTGTSRYALIDEITASDTDYIYEDYDSEYQECKLSNPLTPVATGEGILKFRSKTSETRKIIPSIRCGSTIIKTGDAITPNSSYTEYTLTLSSAEMANITDWADVRVRFLSGTESGRLSVSWAVFEVPDEILVGLEMGCAF
jgi:hypothetical protein